MPNGETKFIRKGEHTNQAMTVEEQMKTSLQSYLSALHVGTSLPSVQSLTILLHIRTTDETTSDYAATRARKKNLYIN